jgi:hypothetical protein
MSMLYSTIHRLIVNDRTLDEAGLAPDAKKAPGRKRRGLLRHLHRVGA